MRNILIVDDSTSIVDDLCLVFEFEGYALITAANVQEALEILQETRPDLIISGVLLPHVTGYELLQHVRSSEMLLDIPFIFYTRKVEPQAQEHGLLMGANAYLTKPTALSDILTVVKSLLEV